MTEARATDTPILDQPQRDRIHAELGCNMLVEAGAGSGKTTELLARMVALIRTGTAEVGEIATVTFTRKAAAELRERFQTRLEKAISKTRTAVADDDAEDELLRLEDALLDIDRGFIGTIHSFCARLLRERPLEARLDPSFREVFGPEEDRLCREAWARHLERLTTDGDPSLKTLRDVNLEAASLYDAYRTLVDQPDLEFPVDGAAAPKPGGLSKEFAAIIDDAVALMPEREPDPEWCSLQKKLLAVQRSRWRDGWCDDAVFFDALERIVGQNLKPTYKRWGVNKDAIRPVQERLVAFAEAGGAADKALRQWQAYRYGIIIAFCGKAAAAYAGERRRGGLVTFNDLLMGAAALLQNSPRARADLARRYRFLMVDEFQDTDPIQAQIVFLLTATDPDVDDWRDATPRDGALFVVGDPKQSIYRFRRADIGIYNQVKARLAECGEVISLTTNFRSQRPIEEFADSVFETMLPEEPSAHQAAFAALRTRRKDVLNQGVFWYDVDSSKWGAEAVANVDAPLIASWIHSRINDPDDDRCAGDFMILTYRKGQLSQYGAQLEQRGVPFQVTGAGVDIAEELHELLTVLRSLAAPHDPVLTAAALVGLFFGISHEQLAEHRLEHPLADNLRGKMFDYTLHRFADLDDDAPEVDRALRQLRGWWKMSLRLPADVVVATIVSDLGLLPYLAAGEAGGSNAGALTYVMNAIRRAGVDGDTSLRAALDALDEALQAEDVEAPLQPGRKDVVRIMNLHKAKGLEAKVVILAHPAGVRDHATELVVTRPETGRPQGAFTVHEKQGRRSTRLAAPLDWDELAAGEAPFDAAERDRLLYVAATRAEQELVIACCEASAKSSPWRPFYAYRGELGQDLDLVTTEPPQRAPLELAAGSMEAASAALADQRRARAAASYTISSVTKLVKHDTSIFAVDEGGLGRAWGNAVHQALEAANRGADDAGVEAICRTALFENDLPLDDDGEPADVDALRALVSGVLTSPTWKRAQASSTKLVEAPFAIRHEGEGDALSIIEGVIDLVFAEEDGWVIVDYKTDVVDDPENLEARRHQYRAQVDAYAEYFEEISGHSVKERQILWVGMGLEAETW